MTSAFLLMLAAIGINGVAQVLLKIGSAYHRHQKFWDPYLNPSSIAGYGLYLASTLLLLYSLGDIPLKLFAAFSSISFIIVFLLSALFLKEKMTISGTFAIFLITAGVAIFNIP